MDYRDLTNILIKVAGIAIIAYAIIEIPAYVSYYFALQADSLWIFFWMSVVPMLVPLLVGFIFLFYPATISNKLVGGQRLPNVTSIDIEEVERIAFSALGLYLIFYVISDLFYHGTSIYLAMKSGDIATYNTGYEHPYALLVATIAELFFAMYLLLGSAGLVRLLARVRTAGIR